ncbi:MAG: hypothetical protein AAF483_22085 [Planctomycetota bacterium]
MQEMKDYLSQELPEKFKLNKVVILCVLAMLTLNFFVPFMVEEGLLGGPENQLGILFAALGFGLVISQLNLIGVWAALTKGRIIVRLPWSCTLLTLIWYSLVAGSLALVDYYQPYQAHRLATALLLGFFIIQIPSWIARGIGGWLLVREERATSDAADPKGRESIEQESINPTSISNATGRFSILDLLVATTVLGTLLGLGKQFIPSALFRLEGLRGEELAIVIAMILTNLIVVAPVVWFAFQGAKWIKSRVHWFWIFVTVISMVEFGGLCAVLGPPGIEFFAIACGFLMMNFVQCFVVFGVLCLLRKQGYRLERQSDRRHKVIPQSILEKRDELSAEDEGN